MKGTSVLYIDPSGKQHEFLVTALNPLNEGFISGVYVDMTAPEPDNLKRVYDIPHMSHESREETNPDLPRYVVNCWKEKGESYLALPADHPQFDHPAEPKTDEHGNQVVKERPLYEAHIAAQKAATTTLASIEADGVKEPTVIEHPTAADLDAIREQIESSLAGGSLPPLEPDVTAQLDAAGPAPQEPQPPEPPATDAA